MADACYASITVSNVAVTWCFHRLTLQLCCGLFALQADFNLINNVRVCLTYVAHDDVILLGVCVHTRACY